MRTIYVVSAVLLPEEGSAERMQVRRWAWYRRRGDAVAACLRNDGDMLELLYTHLVVTRTPEGGAGLGPALGRERWFRADYAVPRGAPPRVAPCAKPASLAGIVGFGLG